MYSLAFSSDGDMLCSSSHTGTVHVFKIDSAKYLTDFDCIYLDIYF